MCVYSSIGQWGRENLPEAPPWNTFPALPGVYITPAQWAEYKKLLEAAKEFDKATGQPECTDPEKTAWMEDVERRMAALEQENDQRNPSR